VRFEPTRQVQCEFEVLGFVPAQDSRPRLETRWSLRSPAGEEVDSGELEGSGEARARFAFPVPLAGLPGGTYTLSLAVRDLASGTTVEGEERIEVASRAGARP